jgi:hypothetical protein
MTLTSTPKVHTGDLDPITANDLDDMNDEMRAAGLDYWGSFIYGNCAHQGSASRGVKGVFDPPGSLARPP